MNGTTIARTFTTWRTRTTFSLSGRTLRPQGRVLLLNMMTKFFK